MNSYRFRGLISGAMLSAFMLAALTAPAQAAMVGTEQLASIQLRDAHVATVQTFLARDEVRKQMQDWGVAPEAAEQRVASLTDAELQQLAANIDQQPAGGDVIVILGVVFLVLLVLELVGVTHIFSKF